MQDIYNYTPKTNNFSREYSVTAVVYLQFVLHIVSFRPLNMFGTFTLALYYYYYHHHHYHHHHHHYHRISHFSVLAGKYSPILGCGNQQD